MINKFIKYTKFSFNFLYIIFQIKNLKLYFINVKNIKKIIFLDITFLFLLKLFLFNININCMEFEVSSNKSLKNIMKNNFLNKKNNSLLTKNNDYITYIPIELKEEIFILIDEIDQASLMSTCHEWKKILENYYWKFNQDSRHGLWQDTYNVNTRIINKLNNCFYSVLGLHINFCYGRGELGDWKRFCKLSSQIKEAPFLSKNSIIINFLKLLKKHIYIKKNSCYTFPEKILEDYKKLSYEIESCLLDIIFKKKEYCQNESYLYLYYSIFIENKNYHEIDNIKFKLLKYYKQINCYLRDICYKYEKIEDLRSKFVSSSSNKLLIMDNILNKDYGPLLKDFRFMANAYFLLGEYEKSKQYYMELIQKSKNFYIFHDLRNAARCFLITKNYREANKCYEEIFIHFRRKVMPEDLRDAGKAAFYCQDYNKSKKYIKKIIHLDSNLEKVSDYRFISCIYAEMKDYKRSINYCKKIFNHVGDSATIQDYRCISYSYANLKKFYKSIKYYEKMINLYYEEITLRDFKNISFVYQRINNYDESSEDYQKFLVLSKKFN